MFHQREVEAKQRRLYEQALRNQAVVDRAPHRNGEILYSSKDKVGQLAMETVLKQQAQQQLSPARSFGLKSLYNNDVSKHLREMNRTAILTEAETN